MESMTEEEKNAFYMSVDNDGEYPDRLYTDRDEIRQIMEASEPDGIYAGWFDRRYYNDQYGIIVYTSEPSADDGYRVQSEGYAGERFFINGRTPDLIKNDPVLSGK